MSSIRYLLDEHVDPLYRTELLKHEPSMTIWRIGILGAPPKGTSDADILRWCEENSFILVTNNRKSMPGYLLLSQGDRAWSQQTTNQLLS